MENVVENARILVVDDDLDNMRFLSSILNAENYEVAIAQDGHRALQCAKGFAPDLILLDVIMPDLDGYETCRLMKKHPEIKSIPVIFLTGKTDPEDILKGFKVGAVDYVSKPFNPSELLARVRTHLSLQACQRKICQQRQELNEMLHILCHDLATPIQAILGCMELSERVPDIWEQDKDKIRSILDQTIDEMDLVRQLRAIEEGKLKLKLLGVRLNEAVERSLEQLKYKTAEKKITVRNNVSSTTLVIAERSSLIASVLNNVLSNAVKFSYPSSEITIDVDRDVDNLLLKIRDQGIGMPQQLCDDLFSLGKSTTRLGTNGERGTGFGMPLVRKFMILYGGTASVSSNEQGTSESSGTEITLSFKVASSRKKDTHNEASQ